jgi:hypothetical protein
MSSLCWCGSGKAYRNCHYDRDKQPPEPHWKVEVKWNELCRRKRCSVPKALRNECTPPIIEAHTVPVSSLKRIARNGHVYTFPRRMRDENISDRAKPVLIGCNRASVFTGFCKKHDNDLFSAVENEAFTATQEQLGLLSYRSVAREHFIKDAAIDIRKFLKDYDKGKSRKEQASIQAGLNTGLFWEASSLRNLIRQQKMLADMLLRDDYTKMKGVVFKLLSPPPVMCSGPSIPEMDFEEVVIQDIYDVVNPMHALVVTSFCRGDNGFIVFSWVEESHPTCKKLMESLLGGRSDRLSTNLIAYILEQFENVYISPDWWDSLPMVYWDVLGIKASAPAWQMEKALLEDMNLDPFFNLHLPALPIREIQHVGYSPEGNKSEETAS